MKPLQPDTCRVHVMPIAYTQIYGWSIATQYPDGSLVVLLADGEDCCVRNAPDLSKVPAHLLSQTISDAVARCRGKTCVRSPAGETANGRTPL